MSPWFNLRAVGEVHYPAMETLCKTDKRIPNLKMVNYYPPHFKKTIARQRLMKYLQFSIAFCILQHVEQELCAFLRPASLSPVMLLGLGRKSQIYSSETGF